MPHTGRQINVMQALALGYHVGLRAQRLTIGVAVCSRESARFIGAWHMNTHPDGTVWSVDRGLWQINSNTAFTEDDAPAFCPIDNAKAMFKLSERGSDWSRWMAFTSGAYLEAMEYTEWVRVNRMDDWQAIDVPKRMAEWCAPVPQPILDWRAAA